MSSRIDSGNLLANCARSSTDRSKSRSCCLRAAFRDSGEFNATLSSSISFALRSAATILEYSDSFAASACLGASVVG